MSIASCPHGSRDSPAPLSPEARAAAQQAIEAEPWNEARKRYALDDLAERGAMQERSRKQAEDVARDSGFAIAEQLGSGFTSIAQLPAAVRRDLDEETDRALRSLAQANLDPTSIAAGGEAALMMSIIASEDPAAFAKEDLRLIRRQGDARGIWQAGADSERCGRRLTHHQWTALSARMG